MGHDIVTCDLFLMPACGLSFICWFPSETTSLNVNERQCFGRIMPTQIYVGSLNIQEQLM